MKSLTSRMLIAALAVPGIGVGPAAPALAGPAAPVPDPAGDVRDMRTGKIIDRPAGDIVAVGGRRADLDTDRGAYWNEYEVIANGSADEEFRSIVYKVDKEWGGVEPVCDGTDAYRDGTIVISFPLSCIENPADIDYRSSVSRADDTPEGGPGSDRAPDTAFARVD
ncbi:hypothetical protein GCM10010123_43840 [Pilimelia anulata]|uniref:Secreted protein n=1 Tax=Pilimelia anulata TaxID=53371 RepID=A0A8J3BBT2_9ACTN|nr:hypothetical protein [Pilimelia anulata]GGK09209.1 hypothetical protein GCM10010123_43840 [Pilimelia anulata]